MAVSARVLRSFDHGRLFGTAFGTGRPWVLALHGWGRTSADFAPCLGDGGQGELDALAVDLPGFGATPPPETAWGSQDYAAAVAPVLEEMAPKVVVLGHSFGGNVAVHLAQAHPDRVAALVLCAVPRLVPAGRRPPVPWPLRAARVLRRVGLVSPARLEGLRQRYGSADYRAARGVMRSVLVRALSESHEAALARLSCPVELVWADDDTAAPIEGARAALGYLRQARLTVCPGAGHLLPLSAPGELRSALERHRP
ncbi:MAG TPA: alpha/beta hydrolase [Acidimicrobiales bacterium]|nr:alpha/beta hydrolase [Acidimicrobiales bacterium]